MTAARSVKRMAPYLRISYASLNIITSDGTPINICIDSGSPISLIDASLAKQLARSAGASVSTRPTSKLRVRGVGGSITTTSQVVSVSLLFGGKSITADLRLLPSLAANIILGVDFLHEHQVDISFRNMTLSFPDQVVPILVHNSHVKRPLRHRKLHQADPLEPTMSPNGQVGSTQATRSSQLHTEAHNPQNEQQQRVAQTSRNSKVGSKIITDTVRPSQVDLETCNPRNTPLAQATQNPQVGSKPVTQLPRVGDTACDPRNTPLAQSTQKSQVGNNSGSLPNHVRQVGSRLQQLARQGIQSRQAIGGGRALCSPTRRRLPRSVVIPAEVEVQQLQFEHQGLKVGPQPKSMESKGAFGVTIYGDRETAMRFDSLVREFPRLFTDDGKFANIPEVDWMPIELVSDWNASGSKLAHKVYPLGVKDREVVDTTYNKLHEQSRMSWTKSPTPFGSPVFVVKREVKGIIKKRPVMDVRGLNSIALTDAYPMPLQSDVTSAVAGCPYISVMDMVSFFYQWPVARKDRHKLTVVSHRGQEHFNVAPMGFKNSPPFVQRQVDKIIREKKLGEFCKAYIDDIVSYSKSLDDHLAHLRRLFTVFQDMNLTMSPEKTFLGFPSIQLLGQHVDGMGLSTSAEKLAAIASLEFPRSAKDLEHYLGLTGWLRSYIAYYAQLAEPLQNCKTMIFRKAPAGTHARKSYAATVLVEATSDMRKAFQALQAAFAKPSMLHHFDRTRVLYIHVDGSKQRGFGVMIAHLEGDAVTDNPSRAKTQPILFLSKTLSPAERHYWPTELEVACLVWTMKRIRWMVEACEKPVVALTDHAGTTSIATQTSLNSSSTDKLNNRLTRASQYLSQFRNLKVLYKPGREHVVPDALSRLPAPGTSDTNVLDDLLDVMPTTTEVHLDDKFKAQLITAYEEDKHMSRIKSIAAKDPEATNFEVEDGLIWMIDNVGRRLCIPKSLEGDIFEAAHDQQFHVGFYRVYQRIRSQYFIRKLASRLRKYLRHCHECATLDTKRHAPYGSLHPVKSPPQPFYTVTIDFIVGLPEADGFDAVLTVTCKSSKRILLVPGRADYAADTWAHRLLDALLQCDWGLFSVLISDRDPKFTSLLWRTLFERLGAKLLMSTAYHPQTDGQSERTNQTVEIGLRYYMAKYPDGAIEWNYILPHLQFVLNNSVSASIGCSPNEMLLGFKPREAQDLVVNPKSALPIEQHRDVLRREAADSIAYAQVVMKERYDSAHTPWKLHVGDLAYLRLQNYTIPGVRNKKLSPARVGPFRIKSVTSTGLACELDLPKSWKIHPTISISELEPHPSEEDPFQRPRRLPQRLRVDTEEDAVPQTLLEVRTRKLGRSRREITEYLARWKNSGPEDDEWLREDLLPPTLVKACRRRLKLT